MSHFPADQSHEDDRETDSAEAAGGDTAWIEPQRVGAPDFFEEEPEVPAPDEPPRGEPEAPSPETMAIPAPSPDVAVGEHLPSTGAEPPAGEQVSFARAGPVQADTPRTTCTVCGNETEALAYCGHCGASLSDPVAANGAPAGRLRRLGQRVRDTVLPSAGPVANGWQLAALLTFAALAILALTAGYVGVALMLGAALIPLLLATTMPRLDLYGRESPLLMLLAAVGGAAVGLLVGAAMGWIADRWWFDAGELQYGAAGYGGRFAAAAGSAPLIVVLLNGVVLPVLALALALAIAFALRRWHQMRNEAMDGMTLGAVAGAGWAVGAAVVYGWPIATSSGPAMSVPDWTLLTLGLTLFRPIILTGATAIVGTAVWQSLLGHQRGAPLVMALVGIAGVLLLGIGTVVLQPRDLQIELLWNLAVALLVMVALRLSLRSALAFDRRSLSGEQVPRTSRGPTRNSSPTLSTARTSDDERAVSSPVSVSRRHEHSDRQALMTCPHCDQSTPAGSYCANCGRPLSSQESGVGSRE